MPNGKFEKSNSKIHYVDKVWKADDLDSARMRAYFGVNIMMGISALPRYTLYWSNDEFIGNTGIKKTMPLKVFEKLTEYLHVAEKVSHQEEVTSLIDCSRSDQY